MIKVALSNTNGENGGRIKRGMVKFQRSGGGRIDQAQKKTCLRGRVIPGHVRKCRWV